MRPPRSRSEPKASAYAVMIHWRLSLENESAFWAEGSAMLTIVASSTTMSWAMPSTPSTSQRRSVCGFSYSMVVAPPKVEIGSQVGRAAP